MYITKFTISGCGPFPLDMLRHDACYPATSRDAAEMQKFGYRDVVLLRRAENRNDAWRYPTTGRWGSFGWPVHEESMTIDKM